MYRTNGYLLDLRREDEAKLRLLRQFSLSIEPPFISAAFWEHAPNGEETSLQPHLQRFCHLPVAGD